MHKKGNNVNKLRIKEREIHFKIKTSAGLLGTDVDSVFIKDQSSYSRNFRNVTVCFCFPLTSFLSQSQQHWDSATSPITITHCTVTVFPQT